MLPSATTHVYLHNPVDLDILATSESLSRTKGSTNTSLTEWYDVLLGHSKAGESRAAVLLAGRSGTAAI